MNRFLFLFLLLLAFAGCRKSADEKATLPLIGKWTFTESYYSIGGPSQWHPVQPANQIIEFGADSTVSSTVSFLNEATHYELVDSTKIKFWPDSSHPSGYLLMGYKINAAEGTLILYPVDPACIEGCSSKFKRNGF